MISQLIVPYRFKDTQMGGSSPWDVDSYFNIWIAPINEPLDGSNFALPYTGYLPLDFNNSSCIPGVMLDSDILF